MSLVDDLEDRVLVEGGLGEDHLVRSNALEDRGELGPSAEPRSAGHAVVGDGADELVRDPAAPRRASPQAREAFPLPDEDDAPADAAARMTSSETDSYAARRRPIVIAAKITEVGMRPEVVKS